MADLNLFKKLNPANVDASFIINADTDLTEVCQSIKMVAETYGIAGVSISNDIVKAELDLTIFKISQNLIARGKTQCTTDWVWESAIGTFLGTESTHVINIVTGQPVKVNGLRKISGLTSGELDRFIGQVKMWGQSKNLL